MYAYGALSFGVGRWTGCLSRAEMQTGDMTVPPHRSGSNRQEK